MYEYPSIIYMYEKPNIQRKGITMKFTGEIFERATIRGVADYLLYGLAPNQDERDYEARLDDSYKEFEDVALQYDKDRASDLLSLANAMTCENACVYMELGLQAGILLISDMIQNIHREQAGKGESVDYRAMNKAMNADIRRALYIMRDSLENEEIKKAYEILQTWENGKEKEQEEE